MKNNHDFRLQIPLWNMALMASLMIFSFGFIYYVELAVFNTNELFRFINGTVVIQWNVPATISLVLGAVSLITILTLYLYKVTQHNRNFPDKAINTFSFIQLPEFLDDDEMLEQVTKQATRKVYILYSQALPFLVILMWIPLPRYVFIVYIILVIMIHHYIYYRDIQKYIRGHYQFQLLSRKKNTNFSKIIWTFAISYLIVAGGIAGFLFYQHQNSEENLAKFDACLQEGKSAYFESGGFFSSSKVTCDDSES
ncbi:hypothetical protein [Alkalihalobacillus pseudalcaliphilus]|uniref:hypothetical protein n=1 Tax=Alkalihalobacillus pseudalcaliphilus TaxID=79884 RepID=UPI00064DA40A|nr:hypothetical protein [Alkalihalobacillus pseudalcaliphilus]KMK75867.1 hypothetical protein AB990_11435 [Alkalihalobacillus pseudalcaliphilus]